MAPPRPGFGSVVPGALPLMRVRLLIAGFAVTMRGRPGLLPPARAMSKMRLALLPLMVMLFPPPSMVVVAVTRSSP
jgi:hypothetical protein